MLKAAYSRLRSLLPSIAHRNVGLLFLGFGCAALVPLGESLAQPGGPDPSPISMQLPPLPVDKGEVDLPLGGDSPFSWVAIGAGLAPDYPKGQLRVRYTIAQGQPVGAAMIFRPGTLDRLDHLDIEIRGNRSTQLVPTLRDITGLVYRFPAVAVQGGRPRLHHLPVAEMQYFPGQSHGPDPGSFDLGEAILLSLVDISAFTGSVPAGTEIEWTVSKLTAVLAQDHLEEEGEAAAIRVPAPTTVPADPLSSNTLAANTRAANTRAANTWAAKRSPAGSGRHPRAEQAETRFFEVFNGQLGDRPLDRSAALQELKEAFFSDPSDPRTALLLGLNYLWLSAEGDRTDLRTVDFLILAEHFLERAQRLAPGDQRIPSWLIPTQQALARIDRDPARVRELEGELLAAYGEDPSFHSFSVALAGFGSPRSSEAFARGLGALRRAITTACPDDDSTCQNHLRWPHNLEGFLTFLADYELKAGNPAAAQRTFEMVKSIPDYASWPYRAEAEERRANLAFYADLYANDDPTDDPAALVMTSGHSCQVCHRAE
ncbi:MAG: hypothetical protein K0U98_08240 [Deltaproteobacteria bacterium]|nr:hypothetical protein [Deltaproteobacteria bacterium]